MMDNINIMKVFNQYIIPITAIIELYSQTDAKQNRRRFDVHAISNRAKKVGQNQAQSNNLR
jgi:hypothetical protein